MSRKIGAGPFARPGRKTRPAAVPARRIVLVFAFLAVGAVFFARYAADGPPPAVIQIESRSSAPAPAVKITTEPIVLPPGQTLQLSCDAAPGEPVVWRSADGSIATVDENGLLTALFPGRTSVSVSAFGGAATDEAAVTVNAVPVDSIRLSPGGPTLLSGEETVLFAEVLPANATDTALLWTSSNPLTARVNRNGVVTAWARGEAVITAASQDGSVSDSVSVTVSEGPDPSGEYAPGRYMRLADSFINPASSHYGDATIMLTGDLMCLSAQIGAAHSGGAYDFTHSFSGVAPLFARADFVMGNLETPVSYTHPYAAPSRPAPTGTPDPVTGVVPEPTGVMPALNAPTDYLTALRHAGFDAVGTANNHCCDTGAEGLVQTLDALDAYGFPHTGTFSGPEQDRFFLANINGIRVGFLAYSEFYNGKDSLLSSDQYGMINTFSAERAERDVAALKETGAEFIIAYIHWGDENTQSPNGTQTAHAQALADAGVDVIVGSHPHCLQKAEYLAARDGGRALCFYSLGNFVSSMAQTMHNDTVVAELKIEKDEAGNVSPVSAVCYPCRVDASFAVAPVNREDAAFARIAAGVGTAVPSIPAP